MNRSQLGLHNPVLCATDVCLHGDQRIERQHVDDHPVTEPTVNGEKLPVVVDRRKLSENIEAPKVCLEGLEAKPAEPRRVDNDAHSRLGRFARMNGR